MSSRFKKILEGNHTVLFVDSDSEILGLMEAFFREKFSVKVLTAKNTGDAIQLAHENPILDFVVSEYVLEDGTGIDIFNDLRSREVNCPFIIQCPDPNRIKSELRMYPVDSVVSKFDGIKEISNTFENYLALLPFKHFDEKWVTVPFEIIREFEIAPADLYLELSVEKTVRIFKMEATLSGADFTKYEKKGKDAVLIKGRDLEGVIKDFIVKKQAINELKKVSDKDSLIKEIQSVNDPKLKKALDQLVKNLTEYWDDLEEFTTNFKMAKATEQLVHEIFQRFNMDATFEKVTKANCAIALKSIGSIDIFKEPLWKYMEQEEAYIYNHSILLAHICSTISRLLDWDSLYIQYQLSVASFVHDLTLDSHQLAKIQTKEDLMLHGADFSMQQMEAFENHPLEMSILCKQFQSLPTGVDKIVLQHHEHPSGKGFPSGTRADDLYPLSSIFISSHHLLNYILEAGSTWNIPDFIKKDPQFFKVGLFRQIGEALVDLHNSQLNS